MDPQHANAQNKPPQAPQEPMECTRVARRVRSGMPKGGRTHNVDILNRIADGMAYDALLFFQLFEAKPRPTPHFCNKTTNKDATAASRALALSSVAQFGISNR